MGYPHSPNYKQPLPPPPSAYEPPPPPPPSYSTPPPDPRYQGSYYGSPPPQVAPAGYYAGPPAQPQNKVGILGGVGILVVLADMIFGMIAAMTLNPVCGSIPIILSITGIIIGAVVMMNNKKLGGVLLGISLLFLITTIIIWVMVLSFFAQL